jgi:hypothetical protein
MKAVNRTLWGQFLREICPLKKMNPKYNAASGIIAGELLICYVSQTMSETNANNIIISILDNGKGSYSLSLDRLLQLFYKTTTPFEFRPLF